MRGIFRVKVKRIDSPTIRKLHFGMGITLGTVQVGSRFSNLDFRNIPGMVPESVSICGFKRIPSNLTRAPRMRDSILFTSPDSFSVTLSSTSSKICVMHSSVFPRTVVFCYPLFAGCSCVSLQTAAKVRRFLIVAIS